MESEAVEIYRTGGCVVLQGVVVRARGVTTKEETLVVVIRSSVLNKGVVVGLQ